MSTTTTTQTLWPSPPPTASIPKFAYFNYYLPPSLGPPGSTLDSKPSTDDLELILGSKNQDTRRLPVHDLRGHFDQFELDACGFQAVNLGSKEILPEAGWEDDEWIRRVYYPVIEAVVQGL